MHTDMLSKVCAMCMKHVLWNVYHEGWTVCCACGVYVIHVEHVLCELCKGVLYVECVLSMYGDCVLCVGIVLCMWHGTMCGIRVVCCMSCCVYGVYDVCVGCAVLLCTV